MNIKPYLKPESISLKGKDLLSLYDLTTEEINEILKTTETLKTMHN
ncbi:MAG: hypothetical protein PWQ68_2027, partial [Thermoanaerobacteraceae bacterium]|nr:hypothetical protein [Thermoanaerobacteraceae bacterium]